MLTEAFIIVVPNTCQKQKLNYINTRTDTRILIYSNNIVHNNNNELLIHKNNINDVTDIILNKSTRHRYEYFNIIFIYKSSEITQKPIHE